ncbi:MAG TPA: M28 family peptidase, partial [Parasegetibacter sp.]
MVKITTRFIAAIGFLIISCTSRAQKVEELITTNEVTRVLTILASDEMEGRRTFTPGIDKAAAFIAEEFQKIGLQPIDSTGSYFQKFTLKEIGFARRFGGPSMGQEDPLMNVVGVIPGKSRADEFVIFSAHYDHLGIGVPVNEDSIFNGANDDASGVTAVIMLAKYFAQKNDNERTLIFAAFTGEEMGGFGSRYFSRQFDSSKVMAMFNIEMIGTDSKWGKNSAFITGYERSDMGKILEKNLEGSDFSFYPDPYPQQQLFFRSDNATLARQGVPAHTISTSKMDAEPYYHTVDDEIETLDLENMTRIIHAIAISSRTIISGEDTPSRILSIE